MGAESPIDRFRRWADSDPPFMLNTRTGVQITTDDVLAMVGLAEALEPFASEASALLSLGLTLNDEDGPVTIIVPSTALHRARAALAKAKGETE